MFFSPQQYYVKINTKMNVKDYKWMLIMDSSDCVIMMSHTRFRVNLVCVVAWMSKNALLEIGTISENQVTATGFEPKTT